MADIKTAIRGLLVADSAVAALVGQRVEPLDAAQSETFPFVVYTTSDTTRLQALAGNYLSLRSCVFRFDCYGGTSGAGQAEALAEAVRSCLFDVAKLKTDIATGVNLQGVLDEGSEDGLEPPLHGESAGIDYVGVTVTVWWRVG